MRYLLVLLFFITGCMSDEYSRQFKQQFIVEELNEDMVACGTEEDAEVYKLYSDFLGEDNVATFNVNVTFYSNGKTSIPSQFFIKRMADASEFFKESESGIRLRLRSLTYVETIPLEDSLSMEYVTKAEYINNDGKPIPELRNKYSIKAFKFWNRVYREDNALNIAVYNDIDANVAGIAGGIGSTYAAIQLAYMETEYRTLEHEIGHMLGLYHPHTTDKSDTGCNPYTGDKVGDTFKSPKLKGIVTDSCTLHPEWKDLVQMEWYESRNDPVILDHLTQEYPEELDKLIHNVMSYSRGSCRMGFTEGQVLRMYKTVETSADLRESIHGMETSLEDMLWTETFDQEDNYGS